MFEEAITRERGTTVILTTHDLGDVEKLCERVLMIDHGCLVFDGAIAELRRRLGDQRVLMVDFAEAPEVIDLSGAQLIRREAKRAWLSVAHGDGRMAELMLELFHRYRVRDLSVQEPGIEDVVRRIYEGHLLER